MHPIDECLGKNKKTAARLGLEKESENPYKLKIILRKNHVKLRIQLKKRNLMLNTKNVRTS